MRSHRGGRVVVVGDVVDDVLVTPTEPVRRDTDTESVIEYAYGGSAANVAAWLGFLGAPADFYGRTGAGDARRHSAALERFGVRAFIDEDPELPTGRIVILIEGDSRTFLTMGGANRRLAADVLSQQRIEGAAAIHLTGHSMIEPWRVTHATALIRRAEALGVPVVLDPSSAGYLRDLGPDTFLDAVEGVDVLLPNLDEGRVLVGSDDPATIAGELTKVASTVVLTMGAEGALVIDRDGEPVHVPAAAPAAIVDPTGAGDAFAAGFHAARLRGLDAVESAREGARVASVCIATAGGRP